jgi:hypothetical protein
MNTPYVKKYNAEGILENPIINHYLSHGNRKQRRPKKNRFTGNGKNHSLTVVGPNRYSRITQFEFDKEGKRKTIYHYILKTN